MKVNIPKNLWISEANVGFFGEGLYTGQLGLTLQFTGNVADSLDIVTEIIEPLTKVELPPRKITRFTGLFAKQDSFIPVLIQAFHSWGFQVQAIINRNQLDLPWLSSLDWLIYKTEKPFVPIVSHELWYFPPETSDTDIPPEPRVPDPSRTVLYLSRGHSVTATQKFITSAKNNWLVL